MTNKIEETWAYVGAKIKPLRRLVFVRTCLPPEKYGLIIIPESARQLYSKLAHNTLTIATVCAVGPDVKYLKEGDTVAIYRLFYAWWLKFPDTTTLGWVDEENIFGHYSEAEPCPIPEALAAE